MDRAKVSINALLPQGWMILGVMGLAPAFLSGRSCEAALAIGLGGMLLASGALQKLSVSFSNLAGAAIPWTGVSSLFRAAVGPQVTGHPDFASARVSRMDARQRTLLEAHDVVFRRRNRADSVLKHYAV
jgi:ATP-binding cassette subfamily B protein